MHSITNKNQLDKQSAWVHNGSCYMLHAAEEERRPHNRLEMHFDLNSSFSGADQMKIVPEAESVSIAMCKRKETNTK